LNKNLQTEAGQTETSKKFSEEQIDTINTLFALLKRNYHNQYFKAFSSTTDLNAVKRLWLESLYRFDSGLILRATKNLMETEEYLPTLATLIRYCDKLYHQNLPEVHSAYLEACRAPSPKANFAWSHLAVYYAGKNSDWYFLLNNPEHIAFPVFREKYKEICESLLKGAKLEAPNQAALPESGSSGKVDKAENKQRMAKLRASLNI